MHVSPVGHGPLHAGYDPHDPGIVVLVLDVLRFVVLELVVLDVLAVVMQPPAPQASQQLASAPTHAWSPRGATHFLAPRLIAQG